MRSVLLLVASLPLAGAELAIDDLRVGFIDMGGSLSEHGEFVSPGFDDDAAFDRNASTHLRWELSYDRSLRALEAGKGSFLWGVALGRDRLVASGTLAFFGNRNRLTESAWILDARAGWAWAFTPAWHIEEGILLGLGHASWLDELPATGFSDHDGALVVDFGFRLGTFWTWRDHWQAGIEARYQIEQSRPTFSDPDPSGNARRWRSDIRVQGLAFEAALGYRF